MRSRANYAKRGRRQEPYLIDATAQYVILAVPTVATAASIFVFRRRVILPLWIALAVAITARVTTAIGTNDAMPYDSAVFFRAVAESIRNGEDPLTALPTGAWSFLPLPAYLLTAASLLPAPWWLAERLVPIVADAGVVAALGKLKPNDNVALLYALNPVAILVVGFHGQLEPLGVLFAITAVASLRDRSAATTGLLAGVAVSMKTWPALFLPGILTAADSVRRRALIISTVAAVLAAQLVVTLSLLHGGLGPTLARLSSHTFVVHWGWSAAYRRISPDHGPEFWEDVATGGSILAAVALAGVWWARRSEPDPLRLTAVLVLTLFAVSPAVATHYLLWIVPLLLLVPIRGGLVLLAFFGTYAMAEYLAYPSTVAVWIWSVPIAATCAVVVAYELRRPIPAVVGVQSKATPRA